MNRESYTVTVIIKVYSLEPKQCYNNIVSGKEKYTVTFYNNSARTFYYVRVRTKLLFHSLKIQPHVLVELLSIQINHHAGTPKQQLQKAR